MTTFCMLRLVYKIGVKTLFTKTIYGIGQFFFVSAGNFRVCVRTPLGEFTLYNKIPCHIYQYVRYKSKGLSSYRHRF